MSERGLFITFESIDGVGKTTQYKILVETLKAADYEVFATKEPGDKNSGSSVGVGIRNLVFKNPTTLNMSPGVADLLFLADHIQTTGDVVNSLKAGKIVISDRYADSQFAYGSAKSKACPSWGLDLFAQHYGPVPDVLLFLKAVGPTEDPDDISWALERGKARSGDEAGKQEGKAWNNVVEQKAIQDKYLEYLSDQDHVAIIPVYKETTQEKLSEKIWEVVSIALQYGNYSDKPINYDNPYSDRLTPDYGS